MSKIEITILGSGTSSGVPVIGCNCEVCLSKSSLDKRLRASVLVQIHNKNILIDTSPDLRQQFLNHKIDDIDSILITHFHKDHLSGLEDIRAINQLKKKRIPVYTNQQTIKAIRRDFYYAFEENKYPGLFEVDLHLIKEQEVFVASDIAVIPILIMHSALPILGFRIKNFTYITDANFISDNELEKIKGSEVLILNALRHKKHHSHYSLNEAIEVAKKTKVPRVYLTHIGHQMGLHKIINQQLPSHIRLAFDGQTITIEN